MSLVRVVGRSVVVRHLARALVELLAVSLIAFAVTELAPGDGFGQARLERQLSPAAVDALRSRAGLDRPFLARYASWVASVAHGDLGRSIAYGAPIAPLVARRALNSLLLVSASLAVTWILVLPLGVWMAARDRSADGRLLAAGATALIAVPDLLIAIALLLVAAASGVLPTGGVRGAGFTGAGRLAAIGDLVRHLVLPVAALTLIAAPPLARHVRASMLDALRAPYLLAAAARGIPYRRLLWRSALRAAANPLVSLFGLSFAALFSASMIVEVVMSWPGLGPMLLDAVRSRDEPLVLAGVMLSTVLLLVGNGCADVLLRAVDPRIAA
ncbi:MAG: ABC transporter substrate-binding protein [Acidobacteria bacterium]|nr:MAG: ABC transporter substrate-binding protein [Acidobacteriota bacterium]